MNSTLQTLYKIARKEKIELAQPFNAVATSWKQASVDVLRQTLCNIFYRPSLFFLHLPSTGRFRKCVGSDQDRNPGAEGGLRVRDTQWHSLRALQKGWHRAIKECSCTLVRGSDEESSGLLSDRRHEYQPSRHTLQLALLLPLRKNQSMEARKWGGGTHRK